MFDTFVRRPTTDHVLLARLRTLDLRDRADRRLAAEVLDLLADAYERHRAAEPRQRQTTLPVVAD